MLSADPPAIILTTQFAKKYLPLHLMYLQSRALRLDFHVLCEQQESLLTAKLDVLTLHGKIYRFK